MLRGLGLHLPPGLGLRLLHLLLRRLRLLLRVVRLERLRRSEWSGFLLDETAWLSCTFCSCFTVPYSLFYADGLEIGSVGFACIVGNI